MLSIFDESRAEPTDHEEEWEVLYRDHWADLARFASQSGCAIEDAEDLVQELFIRLFKNGLIWSLLSQPVERQRIVLRKTLKWMTFNWFRKKRASYRTPDYGALSLDLMMENGEELAMLETPVAIQNRSWAYLVIQRSLARLRADLDASVWIQLEESLFEEREFRDTGAKVVSKRVALHRARARLRDLIVVEGGEKEGEDSVKMALFEAIGVGYRIA
jgi:DNA-directed RNA polymerase specialized sigma24 family protein